MDSLDSLDSVVLGLEEEDRQFRWSVCGELASFNGSGGIPAHVESILSIELKKRLFNKENEFAAIV